MEHGERIILFGCLLLVNVVLFLFFGPLVLIPLLLTIFIMLSTVW